MWTELRIILCGPSLSAREALHLTICVLCIMSEEFSASECVCAFSWSRGAVLAQGHPPEPRRHSRHLLADSFGSAGVLRPRASGKPNWRCKAVMPFALAVEM
jgi:hypothetical protein